MAANPIELFGTTEALAEHKTSPRYEFAEKITQTRIYEGVFALCVSSAPGKGTIGTGAQAGYLVAKSSVEKLGNGFGRLTVTWEAGGEDSEEPLPPDEFDVDPFEINPSVESKALFAPLVNDLGSPPILDHIKTAIEDADLTKRTEARTAVNDFGDLAKFMLKLKENGTNNYYLAGVRYTWSQYSWSIPSMTFGGFIQAPSGPLAAYFDGGLSWLRESDKLGFDGSRFRLTKSWLGGPAGHFNPTLYAP